MTSNCPPNSEDASEGPDERFEQLLSQALTGCTDAIDDLLQECRPYLLMISNRTLDTQLQPKVGASDVVQETMITAQRGFSEFAGRTRGELNAWLRGILLNDLRDASRKYRTAKRAIDREHPLIESDSREVTGPIDSALTPRSNAIAEEEAATLQRCLRVMPEEYRRVIQLRNWDQLPFDEIGAKLGRSSEAARKLWARAVVALQAELRRQGYVSE